MKTAAIILELAIYVVGTIVYLAFIYDPIMYLFGKEDPHYTPWSDMFEAFGVIFTMWVFKFVLELVVSLFETVL